MSIERLKNVEELYGKIGAFLGSFEIRNVNFVKENRSLLLGTLTENEKNLYNRYIREEKKCEFLGGRALVKQCLLKVINRDREKDLGFLDLDIRREKNGFPVLFVENKKRDSLHFSISHKEDYVFCAADPARRIGVDVEKISWKLEKLKSYFMSREEEELISVSVAGKEITLRYYTALWASKECLVKCLKKNLWDVFKKVRLTAIQENKFLLKYPKEGPGYDITAANFMYDDYIFSVMVL
jgi:phosphopantetheinyl transferase